MHIKQYRLKQLWNIIVLPCKQMNYYLFLEAKDLFVLKESDTRLVKI